MRILGTRVLFVFLVICLATTLVWARFDFTRTGIDDSNIFFVYAKNLADGHGFVYNIGGERVEGFSSLLWTLISSVVFSVSTQPELTLLFVNVFLLTLGIAAAVSCILSRFGSQEEDRHAGILWSILFLALLLTSPTYLAWNTISLMDNAVWSTLLLLATSFVIQKRISSSSILTGFTPIAVLLLFTRPESYLWVAVFVAVLFMRRALAQGRRQAFRELVPVMAAVLVATISLTVFRLVYFGYPLPNTYYAKVSPSFIYNFFQGSKYFIQYFVSNPIVTVSILAAALNGVHAMLTYMEGNFTDDGWLFLPVLAGTGMAVPLITGGDHFSSFRFYQGVYPILLLCLLYCIRFVLPRYIQFRFQPATLRRSRYIFAASLVLFVLSIPLLYLARDWTSSEEVSELSDEFDIAGDGRETGQFARELFTAAEEMPAIGVIRAGGIKYTYPGEVIDLMGLNNLLMAHNGGSRRGEKNHAAFEKSTFYQLQPAIVNPEIVSVEDWLAEAMDVQRSWDNTVPLKGLYNDAEFLNAYVFASINRQGMQTGRVLIGWFEKSFLHKLDASGRFIIERYEFTEE